MRVVPSSGMMGDQAAGECADELGCHPCAPLRCPDGKTNYNIRVQETPEQQAAREAARLEAYRRELEAAGGGD